MAIVSSLTNKPVNSEALVVGEVGLSGEVRAVTNIDRLASEAAKLGFKSIVYPDNNQLAVDSGSLELRAVKDIQMALDGIID